MHFFKRTNPSNHILESARHKAQTMLPLCEEATGLKLKGEFKVERLSRWRTRLFSLMYFSKRFITKDVWHRETSILSLIKEYIAANKRDEESDAYVELGTFRISLNLDRYADYLMRDYERVGYIIAHEIIHLLISQSKFSEFINKNRVLCEGVASFYGIRVIKKLNSTPNFDLFRNVSRFVYQYGPEYAVGYNFFSKLSSVVENPLVTIGSNPPISHKIQGRIDDPVNKGSEIIHPDKYIERVVGLSSADDKKIA